MERQTYVDLPAIIAGTSIALAISIILLHFGSMMGIAITPDAEWNPDTAYGQIITICLWGVWVQVLASLIGGYIAGIIRAPGCRLKHT
jgi:NO-binding membrane sensor protein with MHYT domain